MGNSDSKNSKTSSDQSSKKKNIPPQFFYALFFFVLCIFIITWILHDHWAEPENEKSSSTPYQITSQVETKEGESETTSAPKEEEASSAVSLSNLDKRMDRLEGLVSEAGSFEEDIDTLKFSLKTLSSRVASLQEKVKVLALGRSAKNKKSSEEKIKKLASTIETNRSTLHDKLNKMKASRHEQTQKTALIMLCVKAFNISKQALYTGHSWYKPLENLTSYLSSFPEKTALDVQSFLEKLKTYKEKKISTPSSLRQDFLKILPSLQKNGTPDEKEHSKKSYWSRVKAVFSNLVSIKNTRKKTSPTNLPYWKKMEDALNQQQVSSALTILRLKGSAPSILKSWIEKAEDWVALSTLLSAGEETILQTLLK